MSCRVIQFNTWYVFDVTDMKITITNLTTSIIEGTGKVHRLIAKYKNL